MMNQPKSALNILQILISIAKIVILLILPLVMFSFMGFVIPFAMNGVKLFNMGNMLVLLPLAAYALMAVCSFGPLQNWSFVPAIIALLTECVLFASAGQIAQGGDLTQLLALIPQELQLGTNIVIAQLAKPGLGLLINMGLTLLYAVLQFVPLGGFSTYQSGSNTNRPSAGKHQARSSGNRPRI